MKLNLLIQLLLFLPCITFAGDNSRSYEMLLENKADLLGPQTEEVSLQDYQRYFYVDINNGSDKNGDGTRDNPWKTVSYSLDQISDGSLLNKCALLIAEGVYDHGTIFMKEFVDLYGGFSSGDWEREIFAHKTILDGQGVRRVVVGASHARLDGFIVSNGVSQSHGAGILCLDASPHISNNIIMDNLVLERADFDVSHIHQEGNNGGGIACLYASAPVIRNNLIVNNRTGAGTGAGLAFWGLFRADGIPETEIVDNRLVGGVQALVEYNVLIGNISGTNDLKRTRSSSGGGISCAHEARPVIRFNVIAGNRASGRSDAGGIYCEYYADPDILNNWIVGNIADDDGGGLYTMRLGQPAITGNIFAGNRTMNGGAGAIRLSKEGRAIISENLIVQNPGGGIVAVDSYVAAINNIIIGNSGGAGFRFLTHFSYFRSSVLSQNIFGDNEGGPVNIQTDGTEYIRQEGNKTLDDAGSTEEGLIISIKNLQYDVLKGITTLILDQSVKNSDKLSGRVIRIGERWGVVRNSHGNQLEIWGDLRSEKITEKTGEILPGFRLGS